VGERDEQRFRMLLATWEREARKAVELLRLKNAPPHNPVKFFAAIHRKVAEKKLVVKRKVLKPGRDFDVAQDQTLPMGDK
jgi:hypothetical protein